MRMFPLFVLMIALSVITGCGRGVGPNTQGQTDGNCVKRADVQLLTAALRKETATMEVAIKSGADVNTAIEGLGPPIVLASLGNNYPGVKLLLDNGANSNAEDSEGYTALINACFGNYPDMVRLLISKGANVNVSSNVMVNGKKTALTALMIAKSRDIRKL